MQSILTGNKVTATPVVSAQKPAPSSGRRRPAPPVVVIAAPQGKNERFAFISGLANAAVGAASKASESAARGTTRAFGVRATPTSSRDVGYVEPKSKFLKNVYATYYNGGLTGPISGEEYAREQFKKSHKWARANTAQSNKDLEMAVRYLMMKPKQAPRYYNP